MPALSPQAPIIRTGTQIIQSALRLVGSLRSGFNLSAAELTDCQIVLNDLLDSWSAQRIMVYTVPYTTTDQNAKTLTLVGGQQLYTCGNANGNESFKMSRPPKIQSVSVLYSASISTPVEIAMEMLTEEEWQAIANKSTPSLLPQSCYIEATPDATDWNIYFWPVPNTANPVVLYPWQVLPTFANLNTKLFFPPAYPRALRFNLAVDLSSEFPCDLQKLPMVIKIAAQTKQMIAEINVPPKVAWCDPAIVGGPGSKGNIYTGSPGRSRNF